MDTEDDGCLEQEVRCVPAEASMEYIGILMTEGYDFLNRFDCCEVAHVLCFVSLVGKMAHALTSPPHHNP